MYEFGIQYYGIDSISNKKLSRYLPPFKIEEPNQKRLEKIAASDKSAKSSILQVLKEPKREKYYFK